MRSCIRISGALHPTQLSRRAVLLWENPWTDYGFHFRLCFLWKYTNLSLFLGIPGSTFKYFHVIVFKANLVNIMISSDLNSQSSDQSLPVEGWARLYFLKFINLAICLIFDGSNFKHFSFQGSKVCQNILLFLLPPDHFRVITLNHLCRKNLYSVSNHLSSSW